LWDKYHPGYFGTSAALFCAGGKGRGAGRQPLVRRWPGVRGMLRAERKLGRRKDIASSVRAWCAGLTLGLMLSQVRSACGTSTGRGICPSARASTSTRCGPWWVKMCARSTHRRQTSRP
jgi:hypothetical protein